MTTLGKLWVAIFVAAALLAFIIAATAAKAVTYKGCVTIPAGQESSYLLGGRADFMDGIRWTFDYSGGERGRLLVETRTNSDYCAGDCWFRSILYHNVRVPDDEADGQNDGIRRFDYNGSRVKGEYWEGEAAVSISVNVPFRMKFGPTSLTTSTTFGSACQ